VKPSFKIEGLGIFGGLSSDSHYPNRPILLLMCWRRPRTGKKRLASSNEGELGGEKIATSAEQEES
jgi:hypothetical protein